jgi:hypothetical protein
MPPTVEVADIFRSFGPAYRAQHALSIEQVRAMRAIEICRTAELGGHVDQCDHCGAQRISYNSCRNRHCPKCQSLDKEQWLEARQADLLPIPYFHVVFTLPQPLRSLARRNPATVYGLLFKAGAQTLKELARDPKHLGADIGCTALLHTWTQTLTYHPHLHCIVTGGGLAPDGKKWIFSRPDFFLPIPVVARLFRGKFLAFLQQAYTQGQLQIPPTCAMGTDEKTFRQLLTLLYQKDWVVYCKPPFGSPQKTLAYLARYTHRVALSNDRILQVENEQVSFRYRDRTDHNQIKTLTVPVFEFIRRFLLHILPNRFVRIRYYGLLSHRARQTQLQQARYLLEGKGVRPAIEEPVTWQERLKRLTGVDPQVCPQCQKGRMVTQKILWPPGQRDPPLLQKRRA